MSTSSTTAPPRPTSYWGPLAIIGVLFFIFGFVTWVNSVLIAFFKDAFQLSTLGSNLVAFAFFISYTVMAIPSSAVLKRTGFKNGMSLGLLVMAVGTLTFVPAARAASYEFFLVGLFLIGIGLTVLQTASNPYVTILGPRESAAQRISFMGLANKSAGILSQVIVGGILLTDAAGTGVASLERVVTPYLILTGVLVVLAGLVRASSLPDLSDDPADEAEPGSAIQPASLRHSSVFQYPNLVLGVLALFCYVGIEVIVGDTIINYGKAIGFSTNEAKVFGQYTLYGLMAGYVLGVLLIPKVISQRSALLYGNVLGVLFTIGALLTSGLTSVLFVAAIGFAIAPTWPALWPLALNRLGSFTKLASALLIMGISGGALLPLVHGYLTDTVSAQAAYALLLPLFGFILYYATIGYQKFRW